MIHSLAHSSLEDWEEDTEAEVEFFGWWYTGDHKFRHVNCDNRVVSLLGI